MDPPVYFGSYELLFSLCTIINELFLRLGLITEERIALSSLFFIISLSAFYCILFAGKI